MHATLRGTFAVSAAVLMVGLVLLASVAALAAPASASEPDADVLYFWGQGCPVCDEASEWLDGLADRRPDIAVARYEVWHDGPSQRLFRDVLAARERNPRVVPTFVVGEQIWEGFNDAVADELAAAVGLTGDGAPEVNGGGLLPVGGTSAAVIAGAALLIAASVALVVLAARRRT